MTVPREGRLNRLYIQLSEEGSNYDRSQITPELMKQKAQAIFEPYTLDFKCCDWLSAYQVSINRLKLCGHSTHVLLIDWTAHCSEIQC